MKTNMLTLASAAALTMSLALPVYAGTTALTDEALDAVSGKSNTSTTQGTDNTQVSGSAVTNGNVQVGYYQWDDIHTSDNSINKGGNVQSGASSQVQANAVVEENTLAWGAVSQSLTTNTGDIGADQNVESWATLYVGGF
jgi:hypothetical protein